MSDLPKGWTKKIRDLFSEADRTGGSIESWELDCAREYERSLLRPWARFPRDGEIYELRRDARIKFLTHWSAPFTGGGEGVLRRGTRVRVTVDPNDLEPIGVYADAVNYSTLEAEVVPAGDREAESYGGFSLSIDTDMLNRDFVLVGTRG